MSIVWRRYKPLLSLWKAVFTERKIIFHDEESPEQNIGWVDKVRGLRE